MLNPFTLKLCFDFPLLVRLTPSRKRILTRLVDGGWHRRIGDDVSLRALNHLEDLGFVESRPADSPPRIDGAQTYELRITDRGFALLREGSLTIEMTSLGEFVTTPAT